MNKQQFRGLPLIERFLSHVNKTATCWLWTGYTDRGYGRFMLDRKSLSTHRLSYEIHFGEIPDGLCVLHSCDIPSCVNPNHLFLGTQLDNARDRASKGRNNSEARSGENHFSKHKPELLARGEKNGVAKLTEKAVLEILEKHSSGISKRELAAEYKVSRANISLIVNRKSWSHVGIKAHLASQPVAA